MTSDLRYPIGPFQRPTTVDAATRAHFLLTLDEAPAKLRAAVEGLSEAQLDTPYRPEGWTVRQLVHHVADSHLNAYIRVKLALTEENPPLKAYDENRWAALPDMRLPISVSLPLVDAIHHRLVHLLRAAAPSDFARAGLHSENGPMTIDTIVAMYAWHSRHHTAHITALRAREGW